MSLFSDNLKIEDLGHAIKLFRESRDGFLKLFDNSPVCMSMTSTNLGKRIYTRVNKKFLEKFGYEENEIIGHTSIEIGILDSQESARVGELIKEKGRLQNDYVKCRAKSGEIVHTISSIELMEMNNETFLVSFFVDITKVMHQQELIERHAQQLEEVNRELEAFSYSVSHDLRAPLRAIDGYAKALEEDFSNILNDDARFLLKAVQRNAIKMNGLIDDLLEFARLGRKEIEKTLIDMNVLVHEVLAELKKITQHHAEIKVEALHSVMGDDALVRQVVINLLGNAIKYSSKKETPVIHVKSAIEDGFIVYSVQDNGDGFDMKFVDKLFGVFQRLHLSSEFEGTGVGLAIVERVVTKHGGKVFAQGEIGKGALFSFSLPEEKSESQ